MRHLGIVIAIVVLASCALTTGHAQERHGFWFNGGLGYGSLGCDNCGDRLGSLSGGLSLGGTLSPKWLLGVGTTGWTKSEDGATLTVGTLDLRTRFYPSRTGGFFLTGGLGFGAIHANIRGFGSDTETGLGLLLGLGVDIKVANGLSLTPFWNGFAVRNSNSDANVGQIGLSFTAHKFTEPTRTYVPAVQAPPPPLITPGAPPTQAPDPAPVQAAPQGYRRAVLNPDKIPSDIQYIGDKRTMRFYHTGCEIIDHIPPESRYFYRTKEAAIAEGFRASADC